MLILLELKIFGLIIKLFKSLLNSLYMQKLQIV